MFISSRVFDAPEPSVGYLLLSGDQLHCPIITGSASVEMSSSPSMLSYYQLGQSTCSDSTAESQASFYSTLKFLEEPSL